MAKTFITEDFLLQTKTARRLYHEYAEELPVYDYHNHLPAEQIAGDYVFKNLTEVWLAGDHYKWRALRTNGIAEKYITGDASDFEKFEKWAQTVPYTLRNPLYHWTHLELKRYFGIDELLNGETAREIYDACTEMLCTKQYSVRNLLAKANVEFVCTTEGPLDTLEHHKKIKTDGCKIKVRGAYRPDKAFGVDNLKEMNAFIDKLAALANTDIKDYTTYLRVLRQRHDFFHSEGCRLSDYGLDVPFVEEFTKQETDEIFQKIRTGVVLTAEENLKFKSAVLFELVVMDAEAGWVMQLHMGPLRDNNTKMLRKIGPNTGFDSIGDFDCARPIAKFLDRLNSADKLPKTILYNINPRDNAVMATMIGNFQDGSIPGKIQFGSGWWFLDQKQGITDQLEALSNMGLLSRFVGMTTDSRSFLSFTRHEYFRRILCNILGDEVEAGLLPADMDLLGGIVRDICYNNARAYFGM